MVDVATLIKYLVEVGRHLRDGEKQRLEGKDCRGTTLIDIGRLQAVLNGVKTLRTVNELPGECFPCPPERLDEIDGWRANVRLEEWGVQY